MIRPESSLQSKGPATGSTRAARSTRSNGATRATRSTFAKIASATIATAAVLGFLTGCASIPSKGTVQLGPDIAENSTSDFLYFSPYEPPIGGTINDIMSGFLSAGTGPQNDYAVAREYLANNLKTTWLPNERVVVVDTSPEITIDSVGNTASVKIHASAFIDNAGRLTLASSAATDNYEYKLVKEINEWRITEAPNLTIVSRPVFDVVFKDYSLYFFDAQRRYLVPDTRWFPSRASTATRLVNGLIAGPDVWLEGAAINVIPAGTRLAIDAVTISDGVAAIDFNSKFLSVTPQVRGQIKAQIEATLSQISGVHAVQISVDRNIQDISNFSAWSLPSVAIAPVVQTKSSLARLSGATLTPVTGTKTLVDNFNPTDFALTNNNAWVAVNTSQGLYQASLVSFGIEPKLVDSRPGLLPPFFDRQGWLWSINHGASPTIKVFNQTSTMRLPESTAFEGERILSFAISPEGARLAVVTAEGSSNSIWLYGILRDKSGAPKALTGALRVPSSLANVEQVSWLDGTSLGVLGKNANDWDQPTILTVGGFASDLTSVDGLAAFVGGHSLDSRFALTKGGELLQYRGSTWSRVASDVVRVHFAN